MKDYYKWCLELKENWKIKDVEKVIQLFDENIEYYETPKVKIENLSEIKLLWEEIKKQSNKCDINFFIMSQNDESCVVNFILTDIVSYDMVYYIKLNEDNKCIFLKQWYMEI